MQNKLNYRKHLGSGHVQGTVYFTALELSSKYTRMYLCTSEMFECIPGVHMVSPQKVRMGSTNPSAEDCGAQGG